MIVMHKGRLPEKPIRPNIAGRLAKINLNLKKTNIYMCTAQEYKQISN